jgi:hypothetical protein
MLARGYVPCAAVLSDKILVPRLGAGRFKNNRNGWPKKEKKKTPSDKASTFEWTLQEGSLPH